MDVKARQLILASGSPRRIEMMRAHGLDPLIRPAAIEENLPAIGGMKETVTFLAFKKAQAVATGGDPRIKNGDVIIAADTVVYKDEIMGKPRDFDDAFRMLRALAGTWHDVATGAALVEAGAMNARVFTAVTRVWFKDYSDEELSAYLRTDEAYDKAGGYAIQGYFARYVEKIEGDFDVVVGFPWAKFMTELKRL